MYVMKICGTELSFNALFGNPKIEIYLFIFTLLSALLKRRT